MRLRLLANPGYRPAAVAPAGTEAAAFHSGLEGYAPTPLRDLPAVARELGLGTVAVKDESDRLGLPAFKVLGASWAVERTLRERPEVGTLVAASAGNHGRAVARVAAGRGLACRVFLPARSLPARREAIAAEGAEVVVVEGDYEDAVRLAAAAGAEPGCAEIADVGASDPARWVIDGYATLYAETLPERFDVIVVPVGVGSLAAAAARFGASSGATVIGAEPTTAACLTASLSAGEPTRVETPGTVMAGLDCAEVSAAAWPDLLHGIAGTVQVSDTETRAAVDELSAAGLSIGHSGAAPLAALRVLMGEEDAPLRPRPGARVLLVATEGRTDLAGGARRAR